MTLDPRQRFDKTADDYERHRPTYPPALIDWLVTEAKLAAGARIADLGCGTGIASRLFAERGYRVTGIDPSDEMLAKARAHGGATYVKGEASATGLDAASIDLAIAAQAFHWFDVPKTMAELRRILKPNSDRAAAFWNVRASTPLMDAYQTLLDGIGDYRAVPKPKDAVAKISASPEVKDLKHAEFEFTQWLDLEAFKGRARSSSYVAHGVEDLAAFEARLAELFAAHATRGAVEFRYQTKVWLWSLR